ncbi:MAG: phosphate acyltransferase PlsX [Sediminibacterium sp.]|nr:phosphate acyltransferase PlsX [Sediminibacterium sp.]
MISIGVDLMGGDFAPQEVLNCLEFFDAEKFKNIKIVGFGNQEQLKPLLDKKNISINFDVVHCNDVVGFHDQPTKALKEKPNSSIFTGFQWLKDGKIDAFASAGNTGAMLIGVKFFIEPIHNVLRPPLISLVPKLNGDFGIIVDAGLNTDCKPEFLNQFATIGSIFVEKILYKNNPEVRLLNIGEEEGKGNALAQATYKLLAENKNINFKGNMEGRDIFTDQSYVMICDGFIGNILLKLAESLYTIAQVRSLDKDSFLSKFNYENYGGMPILGIAKPVLIGHGISNSTAFVNMIKLAIKMVDTNICNVIAQNLNNE